MPRIQVALHAVGLAKLHRIGVAFAAFRRGMAASRVEMAAVWWVQRRGHVAFELDDLAFCFRIGAGQGRGIGR